MTDEFNNREYVALLLRKVLIGALTVGEAVKNFPFELNEMPNEGDRFATEFVRHFFNFPRVKKLPFLKQR